jgi:hypothetical protein
MKQKLIIAALDLRLKGQAGADPSSMIHSPFRNSWVRKPGLAS